MTITQVITALPDAPDPQTDAPTVFSQKAAASVLAQKGLPAELNAFGSQANAMALEISINAATASAAAASASSTVGAVPWVSMTLYALNVCTISQVNFRTFRKKTSSAASAVDPFNDATNWTPVATSSQMVKSSRTANSILAEADRGSLIDITSGTFTQTFTAAASLGSGWYCYYRNGGTGNITIPASDGMTNWVMYPGEARLFQCDGSAFTSILITGFESAPSASGTFIRPPGYQFYCVILGGGAAGGGGGGGGGGGNGNASVAYPGGGGGSGGAGGNSGVSVEKYFPASLVPATVPFVLGAGGAAGNGGAGGIGAPSGSVGAPAGTVGSAGLAGNASTFGAVGTACYLTASGANVGGGAGLGGSSASGSAAVGVSAASAIASSVLSSLAIQAPNSQGGASSGATTGSASVGAYSPGSDGTAGGAGSTSFLTAATVTGGAKGTAAASLAAGGNGASPTTSPLGCGGAGGGGGAGGAGCGSVDAAGKAGGAGATGAAGGDGWIKIIGIV